MHLVSYTNTHRDFTDLANHGMVKTTKTWISWERNIIFLRNKEFLNLCLRWHIWRSYHFVVEVTFNQFAHNAPFLYLLKTSENHKVCWCFQGAEKECIGSKWINYVGLDLRNETKLLMFMLGVSGKILMRNHR